MFRFTAIAIAIGMLAGCSKPAEPTNPPIAENQNSTTAAPQAGNNSFTEAQARGHLENAGYTAISAMTQDDKGVWHGTAAKAGKSTPVSVDYQGSVAEH
jgi:putative membrane protein